MSRNRVVISCSVLARISKGQGATSEKGTFKRKRWLKKGTLFLDCFYNKLKRNNLRHELKKYMLKRALISLKYFRPFIKLY
jgi:hypothetical protein